MGRCGHLLPAILSSLALWCGVVCGSELALAQTSIPTCTTCNPVTISDKHVQNQIRLIQNDAQQHIKYLKLKLATKSKLQQNLQALINGEVKQLEELNRTNWNAVALFSIEVVMGYMDIYKFGEGTIVRKVQCAPRNLTALDKVFWFAQQRVSDLVDATGVFTTNLVKNYWGVKLAEKSVKMSTLAIQEGTWTDKAENEVIGMIPVAGPFFRAGRIARSETIDKEQAAKILTDSINQKAAAGKLFAAEAKSIVAEIKQIQINAKREIDSLKSDYLKKVRPKVAQCKPRKV